MSGSTSFKLQKKPRVVQSHGPSSIPTPPPETRLSASHVSVENNHGNSSNVVCTGILNKSIILHDSLCGLAHYVCLRLRVLHLQMCVFPVCVYVNKHGAYGPHLDRKLVQQLPDHFGPAPVNAVLQQAVQACVDCTYQPSVLLSFLQSQSHTGGEVIRGKWKGLPQVFR